MRTLLLVTLLTGCVGDLKDLGDLGAWGVSDTGDTAAGVGTDSATRPCSAILAATDAHIIAIDTEHDIVSCYTQVGDGLYGDYGEVKYACTFDKYGTFYLTSDEECPSGSWLRLTWTFSLDTGE